GRSDLARGGPGGPYAVQAPPGKRHFAVHPVVHRTRSRWPKLNRRANQSFAAQLLQEGMPLVADDISMEGFLNDLVEGRGWPRRFRTILPGGNEAIVGTLALSRLDSNPLLLRLAGGEVRCACVLVEITINVGNAQWHDEAAAIRIDRQAQDDARGKPPHYFES